MGFQLEVYQMQKSQMHAILALEVDRQIGEFLGLIDQLV